MKNAIREVLLTLYKGRLVGSQQKAFQVEQEHHMCLEPKGVRNIFEPRKAKMS